MLTFNPNVDERLKKSKNIFYKCVLESHFTSIFSLGASILSKKSKSLYSYTVHIIDHPLPIESKHFHGHFLRIENLYAVCAVYRVAAIFPEHFQSFTIALKNHLFYSFFRSKPSQLFAEQYVKINRHIPAKMN